jgi:hypothetical protein
MMNYCLYQRISLLHVELSEGGHARIHTTIIVEYLVASLIDYTPASRSACTGAKDILPPTSYPLYATPIQTCHGICARTDMKDPRRRGIVPLCPHELFPKYTVIKMKRHRHFGWPRTNRKEQKQALHTDFKHARE